MNEYKKVMMGKWYLISGKVLYPSPRTSILLIAYDIFYSQGCLLLNNQSKPLCTFELPIQRRRACQKDLWICPDLRHDVRYHIVCLTPFEAWSFLHIICILFQHYNIPTKFNFDEQLHRDCLCFTKISMNKPFSSLPCLRMWVTKAKGMNQSSYIYFSLFYLETRPVSPSKFTGHNFQIPYDSFLIRGDINFSFLCHVSI